MRSDVVITFDRVTKTYGENAHLSRVKSLLDRVKNWQWSQLVPPTPFCALSDVSFQIRRGERVGIIGRNGAGKSTTLKLVNRISPPTSGTITVHGSTGGVLELGAGFNPELSGRDNIYLAGTLHGHTVAELDRMVGDIVEISELHRSIDRPLKRYSSGMRARLAFAVSITASPDIVLLDEALAVGDASFKKKSTELMQQFLKDRTVLFVSHSDDQIRRICDRVLYIKNSKLEFDGDVAEGLALYKQESDGTMSLGHREQFTIARNKRGQAESPKVEVTSLNLSSPTRPTHLKAFFNYEPLTIHIGLEGAPGFGDVSGRVRIKKFLVGQINQVLSEFPFELSESRMLQEKQIQVSFSALQLPEGSYTVEAEVERTNQSMNAAVSAMEFLFKLKEPLDAVANPLGERGLVKLGFQVVK